MSKNKEAYIDTRKRLRVIRKLSGPIPDRTAAERLKKIEDIAAGKLSPEAGRNQTSPDLAERLAAGQASRSPRNALDRQKEAKKKDNRKPDAEKTRAEEKGRDRQERGGLNRSADVNG